MSEAIPCMELPTWDTDPDIGSLVWSVEYEPRKPWKIASDLAEEARIKCVEKPRYRSELLTAAASPSPPDGPRDDPDKPDYESEYVSMLELLRPHLYTSIRYGIGDRK